MDPEEAKELRERMNKIREKLDEIEEEHDVEIPMAPTFFGDDKRQYTGLWGDEDEYDVHYGTIHFRLLLEAKQMEHRQMHRTINVPTHEQIEEIEERNKHPQEYLG